ncbi:hypothetical protein KEM48_005617 [Puccinia striiformis f. sp. tritici PST-130]|nr:hypothetical protein KEM48_005617 [Puccinia striiformis f. sp. tritici PST-130]
MHAFQNTLHLTSTLVIFAHLFATLMVVAYPTSAISAAGTTIAETAHLAKRSTEEIDEEQIGIFAQGQGATGISSGPSSAMLGISSEQVMPRKKSNQ